MKPEDKVSILESSSVSVLESTRKDFEALLSSAYSSTSEEQSSSTKSKSRKTLPRKKRLNKNEENPPLDMVNLTPDRKSSSSKQSSGEVNTAFWYEKDDKQSEGASSPSHSSAKSSSKSIYKTIGKSAQPLRVASSSSVVEHRVIVHYGHDSAESISEESEIQSSRRPPSSFRAASSLASSKSKSHRQPKSSRRSTSRLSISDRESEASTGSSSSERQERHIPFGCSVLKLIVHHSGCLILDQPKARPMVIVHALDSQTGSYLQQSGLAVPPQFTAAWTQKESVGSGALPSWNQQLVFHFDVGQQLTNILLLFELVSEPNGGSGSDQQCQLAWGFLRPVSRTGVKHTNKKVQLQLYQIPPLRRRFHSSSIKANVSDFFSCFRNQQRDKYPTTLYVTLSPNETNTVETSTSHSQSQQQLVDKNLIGLTSPLRRGRLGGQPFKLPTRRCFTFGSKFGALVASYNRDGTLLAVALTSGDIYLHCIGDKTEPAQLRGHQGNVYDLDWATDEFVLSSGADCTARLWNLKMVGSSSILAHPAYVYSARFGSEDRIVTACYDQLIRLWQSTRLVASYTQHNAPVNSLTWDTRHELLYSGDASGLICLWNTDHSVELQFEKYLSFFYFENFSQLFNLLFFKDFERIQRRVSNSNAHQLALYSPVRQADLGAFSRQ